MRDTQSYNGEVPDIRKNPLYDEPLNYEMEPEDALRLMLGASKPRQEIVEPDEAN